MKFEITMEKLEEIVLCVVHNHLDEEDAVDYAWDVLLEIACEDEQLVIPPAK